jgi:hypothetical protein
MTEQVEAKIPRTPKRIQIDLREELERMNDYSKGKIRKGASELALSIQHLQLELIASMKFHIGPAPEPGKIILTDLFPKNNSPNFMEMIFVFGSNTLGIHGAGAAKHAHRFYNAKKGVGEGPTGEAYALPTKHSPSTSMTLEDVEKSVKKFLHYASENQDKNFRITQVGCGLGGFTREDIAPLFIKSALESNLYFDQAWGDFLPNDTKFWG